MKRLEQLCQLLSNFARSREILLLNLIVFEEIYCSRDMTQRLQAWSLGSNLFQFPLGPRTRIFKRMNSLRTSYNLFQNVERTHEDHKLRFQF